MIKLADIVEAAGKLSDAERRHLLIELQAGETETADRPAALPNGRYAALRALSGSVHSDCKDISTNKYAHTGAMPIPAVEA